MNKPNVRKIALDLLERAEGAEQYLNLSLFSHAADPLSAEERKLLTVLVYTATEQRIKYDYLIGAISKREVSSLDTRVRLILEIGICQLLDMHSVPAYAAINETVSLAGHKGERAFVNGVLRSIEREKDNLPMPKREKNLKRYLSVVYSFPMPLVKHFLDLYGEDVTEKLLSFFNSERYTDVTVNTKKITRKSLMKLFCDAVPNLEILEDCDTGRGIRIKGSVNPRVLPGFDEGFFFVQDKASLVSCEALEVKAGDLVVDTCSAPGGKSFAAAMIADKVISFDLHESKLSLIEGGAKRLSLDNLYAEVQDATAPRSELFGKADCTVIDVPCSGLGVLGKKPDLRYKEFSSLEALPKLQLEILRAGANYPKVGGALTYSTCTLNPLENEKVVEAFLEENASFVREDFTVGSLSSTNGELTLRPDRNCTDGFFVAKLRRIK